MCEFQHLRIDLGNIEIAAERVVDSADMQLDVLVGEVAAAKNSSLPRTHFLVVSFGTDSQRKVVAMAA